MKKLSVILLLTPLLTLCPLTAQAKEIFKIDFNALEEAVQVAASRDNPDLLPGDLEPAYNSSFRIFCYEHEGIQNCQANADYTIVSSIKKKIIRKNGKCFLRSDYSNIRVIAYADGENTRTNDLGNTIRLQDAVCPEDD
jgi:hypothetical protein